MRDACLWLYGSGFPKGQNIGKSVDKKLGNKREKIQNPFHGRNPNGRNNGDNLYGIDTRTDLTTDFSKGNSEWEGWNTNLKPAYEPIIMARKPLDGTVVNNVLKHGVGGLNIDACRVGTSEDDLKGLYRATSENNSERSWKNTSKQIIQNPVVLEKGRYPANIILDGSDSVEALFPETQARQASQASQRRKVKYETMGKLSLERSAWNAVEDYAGSASRYFYHAKASKADRDEGVNGMNTHATVKPTQLMRYLVKLVTPQGGLVLDPFMGSGSTGKACMLEQFNFVGMELSEEYVKIAEARIEHARQQRGLFNA
jgi:site-specific DNA-methyltransferase (adenine-specific)